MKTTRKNDLLTGFLYRREEGVFDEIVCHAGEAKREFPPPSVQPYRVEEEVENAEGPKRTRSPNVKEQTPRLSHVVLRGLFSDFSHLAVLDLLLDLNVPLLEVLLLASVAFKIYILKVLLTHGNTAVICLI